MDQKETKYQALNRIGQKWPSVPEGNESLIDALILEAWPIVEKISQYAPGNFTLDVRYEASVRVMASLRKYDPSKKQLGGYVLDRVGKALIDAYNKTPEAKAYQNGITHISIETPIGGDDEEITLADALPDSKPLPETAVEDQVDYLNTVSSMTAIVINYKEMERRGGKAQKRSLQNRLCFTEIITWAIQEAVNWDGLNQADILHAIHHEYVNYFSENGSVIDSLKDLYCLRLKNAAFFTKKTAAARPVRFNEKGWLPAIVPKGFFETMGEKINDGQVSEMRSKYVENVQDILKKDYCYSDSDFSRDAKKRK